MNVKIFKKIAAVLFIISLCLSFFGCGSSASKSEDSSKKTEPAQKTITDMLGNKVTIPSKVKKVFCTSPIGTYIIYTVAPDRLLGWNSALSDDEKQYINVKYKDLPVLGGTMGGKNTFNTEAIIKLKPDIILDFAYKGSISASVKSLKDQIGIPVVEMDSALSSTEKSYRLLGDILNTKDKANKLADYVKNSLNNTKKMLSKVPNEKKVKIYYAESADGLKTDGQDNMHTEVIDYVNAENVVNMDTSAQGMGASVSFEQILSWNPDVIVANSAMGGNQFIKTVYSDSKWSAVNAVKNKRVYSAPSVPFKWFDRPPCIARVLGVQWLASKLYPDYFKTDMKSETKKFYKTFYNVDITDAQAESLINNKE